MSMNISRASYYVFKSYETYEVFMTARRGVLNLPGFTVTRAIQSHRHTN